MEYIPKDLSKLCLKELEQRKQILEWQITIARDGHTLREKQARLKEVMNQITIKKPVL